MLCRGGGGDPVLMPPLCVDCVLTPGCDTTVLCGLGTGDTGCRAPGSLCVIPYNYTWMDGYLRIKRSHFLKVLCKKQTHPNRPV